MMKGIQHFIILGMFLLSGMAFGQLSPGPLATPHDGMSGMTKCLSCHIWGEKDPTAKCLDCHTLISTRIKAKQGFHGGLEETQCTPCHTDHMGQDFEMIRWDPSKTDFDHKATGFLLEGAHQKLECEKCHEASKIIAADVNAAASSKLKGFLNRTMLGLGTACIACHEDVHWNELGDKTCETCHNQSDWKQVTQEFDHDKQTKYPLKGAHRDVRCEKCHKELNKPLDKIQVHMFTGLAFETCTSCHEDKHKGAFGQNCLECHSERTFRLTSGKNVFDHEKSRFPLLGQHKALKCEACHTKVGQFKLTASFDTCTDCHKDPHQGYFKKPNGDIYCDQCHNENGFLPALFGVMEHARTNFALDGAHLAQPCFRCHLKNDKQIYRWESTTCSTCHASVHGSQFSNYRSDGNWCEACHRTADWTDLSFDHNKTKFALEGKHASIPCEKCHLSKDQIVQYQDLDLRCIACHSDVHQAQFKSESCDKCHGFAEWSIDPFDHLGLTQFPLDGQHNKLQCGACHKFESGLNTIRFKPIKHDCQDCHSFKDFQ
jgi:hypothetical protein